MTDDELRLSGAYSLDAVDGTERAHHEDLLAVDPAVRDETREFGETAAALSRLTETRPPDSVRSSVLSGISTIRPLPPTGSDARPTDRDAVPSVRRTRAWTAVLAAAAVLIGVAVWVGVSSGTDQRVPTAIEQVESAPDATTYVAEVGTATATIIVSRSEGKAVIRTQNMPNAPDGRDFQLWYLTNGSATSAAIMPRSDDGTNELLLSGDLEHADRLTITEEPAGGSAAPTTEPIVSVDLG